MLEATPRAFRSARPSRCAAGRACAPRPRADRRCTTREAGQTCG
jgi:hypothetical protein